MSNQFFKIIFLSHNCFILLKRETKVIQNLVLYKAVDGYSIISICIFAPCFEFRSYEKEN
jgi:hypothetical protein